MAFGREVDDGVDVVLFDGLGHFVGIADIAPNEGVAGIVADIGQVVQVGRVGEFVVDDDVVVGIFRQHVVDEVGADEAGPAGDKDVLHGEISELKIGFESEWRFTKSTLAKEITSVMRENVKREIVTYYSSSFTLRLPIPTCRRTLS